ncbi:hypothetical protein KP509_12G082700 [Ceratopteris richardii]|uniref:Uncharacterized protein n=1 Tax=Ceratopteris richardii TaxID=49495 RepID=A0A8T2TKM8_CERRI|nr:hypothetical protein KP509_12G082700 [Ceratopteris richardii]KAH7423951.1 hypothetical protein KP509_12G082700 [Ceratopteris richardii]KAH7423952.1 hypothetical protein KP509_12G082700 [Ceratopteris richardii]
MEQPTIEEKNVCPSVTIEEAFKVEDVKEAVLVESAVETTECKQGEKEGETTPLTTPERSGEPVSCDPLTEAPSFKEESYSVADLTDIEKKALESFRLKVEEAIKTKTFFKKPKKKIEEKLTADTPVAAEPGTPISVTTESSALQETEVNDRAIPVSVEQQVTPPPKEDVSVETTDDSSPVSEETDIKIDETPPAPVEGPKNFYIWGIPIHEGDDKTDALLLKFLKARNFKVDETVSMIKSTVKWRKDFGADAIEDEEIEGKEAFEKLAFFHGYDKEGHPVCYNRNFFQNKEVQEKSQFNKFLRWRVQMMEKSIKSHLDFAPGGVQSFIQVIDLQNSPGLLKSANGLRKFISLLQDNYPELAAKQIILNMPWYYYPVLYRKILSEPKMISAGPGKSTETLFKYISPEQVPVEYGGLARLNDTIFEGVEAPVTCLTLKAGETQAIELPIEEIGATLVWDISIVGGDVVYGEEFVPDTYTVIVQKPHKLPALTEPIRNSFKVEKPGKIVITIDNSASKKKKIVVYRSTITTIASA